MRGASLLRACNTVIKGFGCRISGLWAVGPCLVACKMKTHYQGSKFRVLDFGEIQLRR